MKINKYELKILWRLLHEQMKKVKSTITLMTYCDKAKHHEEIKEQQEYLNDLECLKDKITSFLQK